MNRVLTLFKDIDNIVLGVSMVEKNIIKLLKNGKVVGQATFTNYSIGLKYANKKVEEGYTCLILRYIGEREWAKFVLSPPETI